MALAKIAPGRAGAVRLSGKRLRRELTGHALQVRIGCMLRKAREDAL